MTIDFSHLGPCGICNQNIVIEGNHPYERLECDHFFHGRCITLRREKTNQCSSCEQFMKILPEYKYCDDYGLQPLPWKLTTAGACLDADERERIQKQTVAFLCEAPGKFLPGHSNNFPKLWQERWTATVINLGKDKIFDVMDFFLQRCKILYQKNPHLFFSWVKEHRFIKEDEEKEILLRLTSFQHYMCGMKLPYIHELTQKNSQSEESGEVRWQRQVISDWNSSGYERWDFAARLIINGFSPPADFMRILQQNEWKKIDGSDVIDSHMVFSGDTRGKSGYVGVKVQTLRQNMHKAGLLDDWELVYDKSYEPQESSCLLM